MCVITSQDTLTNFHKRVREARISKGLTMDQLSEKAGISPRFMSNIESGSRRPSYEVLAAIALHLEVSTDWLLLGKAGNQTMDDSLLINEIIRNCFAENEAEILQELLQTGMKAIKILRP